MFILRRKYFLTLASAAMLVANTSVFSEELLSQNDAAPVENQQPDIKKISEAFGHFIGRNLNSTGIKFDLESIIQGMRDGSAGRPAPMKDDEYEKAMVTLQEQAFSYLSEKNLKAANEYLEKNATAEGVIEIEPGKLQYIILEQGNGPAIAEHSTPMVNYTGKYIDGTVFGSSSEVGGPIPVPLDQTIQGFSKGIIGMKEGEKRRLFVHPDLGYGKSGQLPPNSLLIFEVEAVKATSPEKTSPEASDTTSVNEEKEEENNDLED